MSRRTEFSNTSALADQSRQHAEDKANRERRWAKLHAEGWSDVQIAKRFSTSPGVVKGWRERNGLPPNRGVEL